MTGISVVIVEDESIVAKDLEMSLKGMGYRVLGTASTGEKAIKLVNETLPDIILMDIMLKGPMSGIEAAEEIRSKHNIPLIYLTAYADSSTLNKAKVTEPHGYIIKPYKEIDVQTAIELAIYKHKKEGELRKVKDFLSNLTTKDNSKDYLFVKSKSKLVKVKTSDIYFVEALKDYVSVNISNGRYTIHSTMKDIMRKLPEEEFIRIHRSFIVRLDKIAEIDNMNLVLENNRKVIPIGGSYREELQNRINQV